MMNKQIKRLADRKNICKEWSRKMLNASTEQLCKMYFDGSDWSIENDFPTADLLRKHKEAEKYGLLVDRNITAKNVTQMALLGDCKATLDYGDYIIGNLFIRHNSVVKITANGNSFLFVTLLDNAKVDIHVKDKAKVLVYKYGGLVTGTGNIEINHRKFN